MSVSYGFNTKGARTRQPCKVSSRRIPLSSIRLNRCVGPPDVSELWIQHQRRNNKPITTRESICANRRIFSTEPDLWEHAKIEHSEDLTAQDGDPEAVRQSFAAESIMRRYTDFSLSNSSYLLEAYTLVDRAKITHRNLPYLKPVEHSQNLRRQVHVKGRSTHMQASLLLNRFLVSERSILAHLGVVKMLQGKALVRTAKKRSHSLASEPLLETVYQQALGLLFGTRLVRPLDGVRLDLRLLRLRV
jgi:hypothetical protein